MRFLFTSIIFTSLLFFYGCSEKQKRITFYPGELWPDEKGIPINAHGGGILLHEDTWYWYGEHKIEGPAGNTAQVGVHVYASDDLYNWKDEGICLKVTDEPGHEIEKGCILERPKVIYNPSTGKFVMWFHLELKGRSYATARSGIAVADHPAGPFRYLRSVRPNQGQWPLNVLEVHKRPVDTTRIQKLYSGGDLPEHPDSLNILGRDFESGQMARDMTLFVDDDGKAYHIFASEENSTLHLSELTGDFLDYTGRYVRIFVNRFMEAPVLFKHNGKYYFIGSGCTGWAPNAARSARAESIWGPWIESGNPCVGEGAELTFQSQSTFVLPVKNKKGEVQFIFMADRWNPDHPVDGRYVWLPVSFKDENPEIRWKDQWTLD